MWNPGVESRAWPAPRKNVLRPILACIWIESGYGIVPTEFEKLADGTLETKELKDAVDSLMTKKKAGKELDMGKRIPVISDFLESEIRRLSAENQPSAVSKDPESLVVSQFEFFHS